MLFHITNFVEIIISFNEGMHEIQTTKEVKNIWASDRDSPSTYREAPSWWFMSIRYRNVLLQFLLQASNVSINNNL